MYPNERLFDNNKVSLRGQNRRTYISLSYVIEFTFSQIWLLNDLFKKYLKILLGRYTQLTPESIKHIQKNSVIYMTFKHITEQTDYFTDRKTVK